MQIAAAIAVIIIIREKERERESGGNAAGSISTLLAVQSDADGWYGGWRDQPVVTAAGYHPFWMTAAAAAACGGGGGIGTRELAAALITRSSSGSLPCSGSSSSSKNAPAYSTVNGVGWPCGCGSLLSSYPSGAHVVPHFYW